MLTLPGFGGGSAPAPAPLPPLPDPDAEEFKKRQKIAQDAAVRRRGFLDTVKTSGLGDTSEATTKRKTLLGQ